MASVHQAQPSESPLSTEELFNQEEKACWEEWLTKVGAQPGLWGGRVGGVLQPAGGGARVRT